MIRLTWAQPEDLVPHELVASGEEHKDVAEIADRWLTAGGSLVAPESGATPSPAPASLRSFARDLLDELDATPAPLHPDEPDELAALEAQWRLANTVDAIAPFGEVGKLDAPAGRVHGAWLGRAAGCLLGKPVEKTGRAGIRAILEATGEWPLRRYFTATGLDDVTAAAHPWNRRSAPTSLRENIDGMPEDDDLNFPLIALRLLESARPSFTVDDVATSWLAHLPGGRVFTAERIVYRNLLDGIEPDIAATVRNPFRQWIGAQIRTDVYGWANPGDPLGAARLAWQDARLSHRRNGVFGAMFAAAACAVAVVADDVETVLDVALAVVPPNSRYAEAIRFGRELGASGLDAEMAVDELVDRFAGMHWVHVLNNSALLAFALTRGRGDFGATITTAVAGGWDTDSVGATAGSIVGALVGADELPAEWIDPLRNRLASSVPGFDGIGFDVLAERTTALTGRSISGGRAS